MKLNSNLNKTHKRLSTIKKYTFSTYVFALLLTLVTKNTYAGWFDHIITDFGDFLILLYQIILPVAIGVFGVPLIIINSYKIMTSQGDPAKAKDGKEGLGAAIAGIIFVAGAAVILRIILTSIYGVTG